MRMSAEQLHWTLAWASRAGNVANPRLECTGPGVRRSATRHALSDQGKRAQRGGTWQRGAGIVQELSDGAGLPRDPRLPTDSMRRRARFAQRAQDRTRPSTTSTRRLPRNAQAGGLMSWADFGGVRIRAKIDRALRWTRTWSGLGSAACAPRTGLAIDLIGGQRPALVAYYAGARTRARSRSTPRSAAREATVDFAVKGGRTGRR